MRACTGLDRQGLRGRQTTDKNDELCGEGSGVTRHFLFCPHGAYPIKRGQNFTKIHTHRYLILPVKALLCEGERLCCERVCNGES